MKPFESANYLDIDSSFSEEEIMIRNAIRQFVSSEIMPGIAEHFEKGTFPKDLILPMAELGG